MSIVSLETGGLGGHTRDLWREHLQGEVFQGWDEINEVVSADFWKQQLLLEPKVVIQPGADARERYTRARSWLGITAEFATCAAISNGASPTYEGTFRWTVSINNQAVDVIRAGFVQFELPNQSPEAEDTFAPPVEEAGAPGSDVTLKAPRTKGRVMTDVVVEAGILALPWELQPAARDHLTDEVRQVIHDAVSSIAKSGEYGPKVMAEVWDSIKEDWPAFVALTTGLIAAEITAAALLAAPEGTVTKILGIIINAIIIAFLLYAVVTEGAEVVQQGVIWWNLVKEANGDPKKIAEAAETFARMVLHLMLALMAAAGLRSKVASTVPKPKALTAESKPFFKSQLREIKPTEHERVHGGSMAPEPLPSAPPVEPRAPIVEPPAPTVEPAAPATAAPKPAKAKGTTRRGVKRTNRQDWRKLMESWDDAGYGDILSPENKARIKAGKVPVVDEAWVRYFPGDAKLVGEQISMHHIDGSKITVPLPKSRHKDAHTPGGFKNNPGGPGQTGSLEIEDEDEPTEGLA